MADGKTNEQYDYDLFVIGAGSGGVRAARISATYGARVAIAESTYYGGTCVNVGCVPKKLFVYGSGFSHDFVDAKFFGWNVPSMEDGDKHKALDWNRLIQNKNKEIERLNGVYVKLLKNAGVEIIDGFASMVDANTVQVGEKSYTAKKILIAVGSTPFIPDFPGKEHVITSNEAFYLEELPEKIMIVGGGYIAVEFACILKGYGSKVTLCYRGDLFLRGFDHDVREFLAQQMRDLGIELLFNNDIKEIQKDSSGKFNVSLIDGSTREKTDKVMYATGRVPNIHKLGLEKVGVKLGSKNEILVNDYYQTNIPSIFALGDVINRKALTPVALNEGHAFADTQFGNKPRTINYDNIPTAVFSQPPIGTCGLTEEEAEKEFGKENIDIYKTSFKPLKHTLTESTERVFMKLIVERNTDKVVGCHIIEHSAGETIQMVGVAMKAGATKAHFDQTIGVHPTSAEELVTMRTKFVPKK